MYILKSVHEISIQIFFSFMLNKSQTTKLSAQEFIWIFFVPSAGVSFSLRWRRQLCRQRFLLWPRWPSWWSLKRMKRRDCSKKEKKTTVNTHNTLIVSDQETILIILTLLLHPAASCTLQFPSRVWSWCPAACCIPGSAGRCLHAAEWAELPMTSPCSAC